MWYGLHALSEPLALLASRATSPVRRAERRSAMATANKKSRAVETARASAVSHAWAGTDGVPHLRGQRRLLSLEDSRRRRLNPRAVGGARFLRRGGTSRTTGLQRCRLGAFPAPREWDRTQSISTARRAASDEDSDAERWLDEGGSFSSEAVAQWPAPHLMPPAAALATPSEANRRSSTAAPSAGTHRSRSRAWSSRSVSAS